MEILEQTPIFLQEIGQITAAASWFISALKYVGRKAMIQQHSVLARRQIPLDIGRKSKI
jgi:hypothetical protein